ncbi:MAG: type II toxin-antitoxin system VapC family toxin [bacterium]
MKERLLLDTDVLIDYLRGREAAVEWLEARTEDLLVSVITVSELAVGIRGEEEDQALEEFLDLFEVVPLDRSIASRSGRIRQAHGAASSMSLADAVIAASAISREAVLQTFNWRHYPTVERIQEPYDRGSA